MLPQPAPQGESMFEGLKKFKVVKPFCGYQVGTCISFNGKDAEKYAKYVVSCEKAVAVEEVKKEEAPVKAKRKYVRRGKK